MTVARGPSASAGRQSHEPGVRRLGREGRTRGPGSRSHYRGRRGTTSDPHGPGPCTAFPCPALTGAPRSTRATAEALVRGAISVTKAGGWEGLGKGSAKCFGGMRCSKRRAPAGRAGSTLSSQGPPAGDAAPCRLTGGRARTRPLPAICPAAARLLQRRWCWTRLGCRVRVDRLELQLQAPLCCPAS